MMGCRHELGKGRIPQDGVVREVDVGDVEVDELYVVVVAVAKCDWEARSRERTASFSSEVIVMTLPLPGILRTL